MIRAIVHYVKSISFFTFSSVLLKISSFSSTVLISRYLLDDLFGQYAILKTTITTFSGIANLGLGILVASYVANQSNIRNVSVTFKSFVFLALILSSIMILNLLLFEDYFIQVIKFQGRPVSYRLAVLSILALGVNSIFMGTMHGKGLFTRLAKNLTVAALFNLVLTLLLVVHFNIDGAILSLMLFNYVQAFLNGWSLSKYLDLGFNRASWRFSLPKKIFIDSIPVFLGRVLIAPCLWWGSLVLLNSSSSLSGVGELEVYNQLLVFVLFIPQVIAQMSISNLSQSENKSAVLKRNLYLGSGSALVVALFLLVVGRYLITELFALTDYNILSLSIYVGSSIFITISLIGGQLLNYKRMFWLNFGLNTTWGIIFVLMIYIFKIAFEFRIVHYSLAWLISYLTIALVHLFIINRKLWSST